MNNDLLPFEPVGINNSVYSQELFIDVNDESMINELLWRVDKHILDKDLSNKINNLSINISTEIYQNNKNDIEIYIRFKDINNNEYAHTSIHLTGDCFDKKLNGILHTKNIKTGARIKIHVDFYGFKTYKNTEKQLDISKEYIAMKYKPNSIANFKSKLNQVLYKNIMILFMY